MKKTILAVFLAGMGLAACKGPNSIENKHTDAYISLHYSKVDILIPPGFQLGAGYSGIEDSTKKAGIREQETATPVHEFIKDYSKEKLKDANLAIVDSQKYIINGMDAWLMQGYTISGDKGFAKWILVTGTDSESIILIGSAPKEDEKTFAGPIKKALLGMIYFPHRMAEKKKAMQFSFTNNTGLKYAGTDKAMQIFTEDGALPGGKSLKTSLYVSTGPIKPDPGQDMLDYSQDIVYFSSPGMHQIRIDTAVTLNNPSFIIYEVLGSGIDSSSEEKATIYQATAYYDNNFFMLKGIFNKDKEENIKRFRETAQTLIRK